MRIFFTGGSGKAGRHVAPYLAEQGHHVTNADLVPLEHPAVADLRVDLTDAGETYSALAGLATFEELDLPKKPSYDAVVRATGRRNDAPGRTSDRGRCGSSAPEAVDVPDRRSRRGVPGPFWTEGPSPATLHRPSTVKPAADVH
jgi:NAD(P)-dependent dehydrogenase (short-subunit alcohol dehydrogenase family)